MAGNPSPLTHNSGSTVSLAVVIGNRSKSKENLAFHFSYLNSNLKYAIVYSLL